MCNYCTLWHGHGAFFLNIFNTGSRVLCLVSWKHYQQSIIIQISVQCLHSKYCNSFLPLYYDIQGILWLSQIILDYTVMNGLHWIPCESCTDYMDYIGFHLDYV